MYGRIIKYGVYVWVFFPPKLQNISKIVSSIKGRIVLGFFFCGVSFLVWVGICVLFFLVLFSPPLFLNMAVIFEIYEYIAVSFEEVVYYYLAKMAKERFEPGSWIWLCYSIRFWYF